MKRLAWLLGVGLMCALPGRTLADSHGLSVYGKHSSSCGLNAHDDDGVVHIHSRCLTGIAVKVSWNGMKVRPPHGTPFRVWFTDATVFETDSGEGVLDGLVVGDYVCVTYMHHSGFATAVLVVFAPESMPCSSSENPRFLWSGLPFGALYEVARQMPPLDVRVADRILQTEESAASSR
jgi:hypothetical protein